MNRRICFSLSIFLILSFQIFAQSIQKYADIGDFKLENGQVIKDCKIGYRTFGKLNEAKSNAMLFPTWFGGNSQGLVWLIGPGKIADSTKYFVIAIDALGDGISSSPSNSILQPKEKFPEFNIRDMVNSQYEFVTKFLKLNHLFCVIGGSMGGMQTFQWIVSYPDFMDKAVAWVGSPKLTSYDLLLWNTELQAINMAQQCGAPSEMIMKTIADITDLNIETPEYHVSHTKPEEFYSQLKKYQENFSKNFNLYDWKSQLKAMIAHNVSAPYGNDMNKAAARVKTKVLSIVSLQDHMVDPQPAIDFAKLIHAQTIELNNDCGHLGPGCEIEKVNKTINEFLEK
ncbi:MAG: alpha/beta fold hydrolase [Bacteroidetes bacterium]|nr:alpha/beta fold hydrolase [Bacteroidota bacterium]